MDVEPEFIEEVPQMSAGEGQFEFYGQIFELHVQQLVKLHGAEARVASRCWSVMRTQTTNSASRPNGSCRTYTIRARIPISIASWSNNS